MDCQYRQLYCSASAAHYANLHILYLKGLNYQTRCARLGLNPKALHSRFSTLFDALTLETERMTAELNRCGFQVSKDLSVMKGICTLKHMRISELSLAGVLREFSKDIASTREAARKAEVYRTMTFCDAVEEDGLFMDALQKEADGIVREIQKMNRRKIRHWNQIDRQLLIQV